MTNWDKISNFLFGTERGLPNKEIPSTEAKVEEAQEDIGNSLDEVKEPIWLHSELRDELKIEEARRRRNYIYAILGIEFCFNRKRDLAGELRISKSVSLAFLSDLITINSPGIEGKSGKEIAMENQLYGNKAARIDFKGSSIEPFFLDNPIKTFYVRAPGSLYRAHMSNLDQEKKKEDQCRFVLTFCYPSYSASFQGDSSDYNDWKVRSYEAWTLRYFCFTDLKTGFTFSSCDEENVKVPDVLLSVIRNTFDEVDPFILRAKYPVSGQYGSSLNFIDQVAEYSDYNDGIDPQSTQAKFAYMLKCLYGHELTKDFTMGELEEFLKDIDIADKAIMLHPHVTPEDILGRLNNRNLYYVSDFRSGRICLYFKDREQNNWISLEFKKSGNLASLLLGSNKTIRFIPPVNSWVDEVNKPRFKGMSHVNDLFFAPLPEWNPVTNFSSAPFTEKYVPRLALVRNMLKEHPSYEMSRFSNRDPNKDEVILDFELWTYQGRENRSHFLIPIGPRWENVYEKETPSTIL